MAIDKLIPQYLTSDTDQKLIKSVEMTDNLNVRISNDDEGTAGVVKNVKGTTAITGKGSADIIPTGDNRVIGSVANEKNKEVLFLLWNSNGNHGIYKIDLTTNKFRRLYFDSVLNFSEKSYAKCDVVINEDEETLLYFTDNLNPPMKVNINRLETFDYPAAFYSGTDEEKLLSLTAAKQPPLKPPTFTLVNNPNVKHNLIKEKNFQFAYKYVYTDGEHSALSPYSSLAFASNQFKYGFINDGAKDFFNQINVFVRNTKADVREIVLYAREGNRGTFYEVATIDNNDANTNARTINFINETIGKPLSDNDLNRVYDNVPQLARAQAFAGGRIMYGNYTEGYENIDTDTELLTNYHKKEDIYNIDVTIKDPSSEEEFSKPILQFDYTSLPASVPANSKILLNFVVELDDVHIGGNDYGVENIVLDDGDLEIQYNKIDDVTALETKTIDVEKIKGESFFSANWSSFLGGLGVWWTYNDTFVPALTMRSEGVYFREVIDVSTTTTLAGIKTLVENRITSKTYDCFLNPTQGVRRLSVLEHTVVNLIAEKGAFKGSAKFKVFTTGTADEYELSMQYIDLEPFEFFKNGTKPTEILSTNRFRLNVFSGTRKATPYFADPEIIMGATGVFENLDGYRSFKSGSSHRLGVVYLDDRGRASGVQELGSSFVEKLNNRGNENDLYGQASVVMRLKHSAPSWAKKWLPVYTGMGDVEMKLMYGVNGAFIPTNNLERTTSLDTKNKIYVSLNSIFGEGGYNKSFGADINYKYEKGDRLRIIRYDGDETYRDEFNVLGFERLTEDESTNPIFDKVNEDAKSVTSGDFLIIEDNGVFPFSYSAVANNNSKWFGKCIVEVYRPLKQPDEFVYYDFGKAYDISSGTHSDERGTTTPTIDITKRTGTVEFNSSDIIFKGDILSGTNIDLTVLNVYEDDGTYYAYAQNNAAVAPPSGSSSVTVTNPDAVIQIDQGDVYFRPHLVYVSNKQIDNISYKGAGSTPSIVDFLESYSICDFFDSKDRSQGKPYGYIPDAKTIRRIASVTYSDAFVSDSEVLGLSAFNLSLANWTDLDISYGQIDALIQRGDALTVLQDSKASQMPIGRNLIEYSGGQAGVTVSRNVLGVPSYYAGDYGTSGNPESVVERFGVVYYTDVKAGKVIRISADGITPISEKGMSSFFENTFKELVSNSSSPLVVGGFDPDNDEYLISIEGTNSAEITIGSDTYDLPTDGSGNVVVTPTYTSQTVLWNLAGFDWDEFCGDWDEVGNGVVFLDNILQSNGVLVDIVFMGTTGTIDVIVTDSDYSFTTIGQLNLSTGVLTIPSTTCTGTAITIGDSSANTTGVTISYKHKEGVWGSKYSFVPSNYVSINNTLYGFYDNGTNIVWEHNVNTTRNNFYGTQYDSMFEVVSNFNPSMIKTFEALGVEGDGTWTSTLTTSDQQTSISSFDEREKHRYALIPRDTLVSTSHKIFLGVVDSVSGDNIKFTTPLNRLPFVVGDTLNTVSGSTITSLGVTVSSLVDRKTIECSATPSVNAGDHIVVQHTASVDGDPMRDVFLKIKMETSDTSAFEVHAISVNYDRSRLHNDRVN